MGEGATMAPPAAAMFVQLALLGLFWGVLALHLLRLIAVPLLADAHPLGDAAQAGMAAGMVYLLFPGASAAAHRPLAVLFGAAAVVFALTPVLRARRRPAYRAHELVLLTGNAAMALLLAGGSAFGLPAAFIAAACLAATAGSLLRPVLDPPSTGRHRRAQREPLEPRPQPVLVSKQRRLLVTAPQIGSVAMTFGMAWMLITG